MTQAEIDTSTPRLLELGELLCSCRTMFQAMWEKRFYEPSEATPSEAWADFQMIMAGPGGLWPTDFNRQPRSAAIKLLHQQADYCFALGLLVSAPEVRDPAATLVRSVVEYGARGFWLLDPKVDHRVRCVRAFLLELVSFHHAREAASDLPESPEFKTAKAAAKTDYRAMKKQAEERFNDVQLADDPTRWSIEGQVYPTWTAITQDWSEAAETGVNGAALYKLLAVAAHPQGFVATTGLHFGENGEGYRVVTTTQIERLVQIALASFFTALTLVANYHHQWPAELSQWQETLEKVIPGFFNRD